MYAMARRGEITGWTGIDDPYEAPSHPEIVLETLRSSAEENARRIITHLVDAGFVRATAPFAKIRTPHPGPLPEGEGEA